MKNASIRFTHAPGPKVCQPGNKSQRLGDHVPGTIVTAGRAIWQYVHSTKLASFMGLGGRAAPSR